MNVCFPSVRMTNELENRMQIELDTSRYHSFSIVSFYV
jgi:hypothetical protein